MNLYRFLAISPHPAARNVRRLRRMANEFSVPAPRLLFKPALGLYLACRSLYYFGKRVFICEPLFKAYCTQYGRRLRTGVYVHWIQGKGRIVLGDDVCFDGKCSISFAVRFAEQPELIVGNHTGISHGSSFTIGKSITIGNYCRIAGDVHMFDSSGHPSDAAKRAAGAPPSAEDVKPIRIQDHVWIGRRVIIFPGVTIGEGCIVSAGSIVMSDIPPYSVVAGNPARKISSVMPSTPPEGDRKGA